MVGVQPVAAGTASRLKQPVAALPRAQQVGADTRAPRELSDAECGFGHGAEHSHRTNIEQGLDSLREAASLFKACAVFVRSAHPSKEQHATNITRRRGAATVVATLAVGALASAPAGARPAAEATAESNIVETAVAAGNFTTLVSLVKQAGLAETLVGKGPFTVFAPTDAAFKKVPKKTLNALGKDKARLKSVLLYHVAEGGWPRSASSSARRSRRSTASACASACAAPTCS